MVIHHFADVTKMVGNTITSMRSKWSDITRRFGAFNLSAKQHTMILRIRCVYAEGIQMGIFSVGGNFKPMHVAGVKSSRFIEPHDCEEVADYRVKYDNAKKLAVDVGACDLGFRAFAVLDGKFIFGDFVEALIVENNWLVEDLTISTLSMSQDNIDSLRNLITGDYVQSLNIIVSHYYFANERLALMPYLYEKLDVDNKFQLAVASVHTKICMIKTSCGKKITIHGSANLRSSSNIEQLVIEHSPELYDFTHAIHAKIVEAHKTINKPVRRSALWQAVLTAEEKNPASLNTTPPAQQRNGETHSAARKAGV